MLSAILLIVGGTSLLSAFGLFVAEAVKEERRLAALPKLDVRTYKSYRFRTVNDSMEDASIMVDIDAAGITRIYVRRSDKDVNRSIPSVVTVYGETIRLEEAKLAALFGNKSGQVVLATSPFPMVDARPLDGSTIEFEGEKFVYVENDGSGADALAGLLGGLIGAIAGASKEEQDRYYEEQQAKSKKRRVELFNTKMAEAERVVRAARSAA